MYRDCIRFLVHHNSIQPHNATCSKSDSPESIGTIHLPVHPERPASGAWQYVRRACLRYGSALPWQSGTAEHTWALSHTIVAYNIHIWIVHWLPSNSKIIVDIGTPLPLMERCSSYSQSMWSILCFITSLRYVVVQTCTCENYNIHLRHMTKNHTFPRPIHQCHNYPRYCYINAGLSKWCPYWTEWRWNACGWFTIKDRNISANDPNTRSSAMGFQSNNELHSRAWLPFITPFSIVMHQNAWTPLCTLQSNLVRRLEL